MIADNSVGLSIIKGACNSQTKELTVDLAELGLDSMLDEGLLREIPVLRSIAAAMKTAGAIRDRLFLKRVALFLAGCPAITDAERKAFAEAMLKDEKQAKKLSDTLVLILDRLDDLDKASLIAKAFIAYVRKKVPLEAFKRLATAIDIGFIDDLTVFIAGIDERSEAMKQLFPSLIRCGMADLKGPKLPGERALRHIIYEVNDTGRLFVKCMKNES